MVVVDCVVERDAVTSAVGGGGGRSVQGGLIHWGHPAEEVVAEQGKGRE